MRFLLDEGLSPRVVDFKHFLPRLFEIISVEGFPDDYPDIETVFSALQRGKWHTWPSNEQSAVETCLLSLWQSHLTSYPTYHATDTNQADPGITRKGRT